MAKRVVLVFLIAFILSAPCLAANLAGKFGIGGIVSGATSGISLRSFFSDNFTANVSFNYISQSNNTDQLIAGINMGYVMEVFEDTLLTIGGGVDLLQGKLSGASINGYSIGLGCGFEYLLGEHFSMGITLSPMIYQSTTSGSTTITATGIGSASVGGYYYF